MPIIIPKATDVLIKDENDKSLRLRFSKVAFTFGYQASEHSQTYGKNDVMTVISPDDQYLPVALDFIKLMDRLTAGYKSKTAVDLTDVSGKAVVDAIKLRHNIP